MSTTLLQPDLHAIARRLALLDPTLNEADTLQLVRGLCLNEVALIRRFELPRVTLHGLNDLAAHLDAMGVPDGGDDH